MKTAGTRNPGDPDARTLVEQVIRVDQAGEFGAVRIYERQIAAFLERHPEFKAVPVLDLWQDVIGTEPPSQIADSPYLRLSPLKHGTDGFFAAALVREEKKVEEKVAEPEAAQ